jgi:DNA-binding LacI/PurR family transcriptional regulator/DNA-binding transcriptional regulator YhcF (GntR family)
MKPQSYRRIAENLETRIRNHRVFRLPTLLELCEQTGVSYCTAWRAYRLLIKKGVLVANPGKKTALALSFRAQSIEPLAETLTDRLYLTLRKRIVDGEYHAGDRFPKISYFVVTEKISHPVVTRAFIRLSNEGLAHRERNRWVVGPEPGAAGPAQRRPGRRPTVLVLAPDTGQWYVAFEEPYTNSFFIPFMDQLVKHRFGLSVVAQWTRKRGDPGMPAGLDEVQAAVKALGEDYRGILVITIFPVESRLEQWIARLCRFGKPVVYLDTVDKGAYLTRRTLSVKEDYYRLHTDERAAAALVLDALAQAGHRIVGIHGPEQFDWGQRRTDLICEVASRMDPPLRLVCSGSAEEHWGFRKRTAMHQFVDAIKEKIAGRQTNREVKSESLRRALIKESPSLVSLLRDQAPTALIALNDQMAWEYHYWCRLAGIQVPRDLSMVSFDNIPQSVVFPISTVDFGLTRLGHLASHILIGDLPIKADTSGNIAGECMLVDRGSVAKPEDRQRLRRLLSE